MKPRSTFFDRSARSTRRIRCSRRRRSISRSYSWTAGRCAVRCERLRRDRQRVGAHPHVAAVEAHDAGLLVHVEVEQLAAAEQEVAPVGARVEGDDVVREDALVDVLAHVARAARARRPAASTGCGRSGGGTASGRARRMHFGAR